MKTYKIISVVALVVAIGGAIYAYSSHRSASPVSEVAVGAIGTNAIEGYIPAILYNEGYYSNLPITTTSGLTVASITDSGALTVLGGATITGATSITGSLSLNGVVSTSSRQSFVAATTTPCSIKSPSSTSTLDYWNANFTTGTSTGMAFDLASSTSAFSTSTNYLLKGAVLASGTLNSFPWFPSSATTTVGFQPGIDPATGVSQYVLAPSTWITMKTGAGLLGFTYGGTCQAKFTVL